jgi:murein DD-endopeptidase MepM/ murein hydrolase activator NlpD
MASGEAGKGGGKGAGGSRAPTPSVQAAPVDKQAQKGIASASIVAPVRVQLTIRDSHTGAPVAGASVKDLVVEHIDGPKDALQTLAGTIYAAFDTIPKTPPVFTEADNLKLIAAVKAIPTLTKQALEKKTAERAALLSKRDSWTVYAAWIQSLVKLLCAWKGFTPGYTGPADGSEWPAFEKDYLIPVYGAVVGRPFVKSVSLGDAAKAFQKNLSSIFRTDDEGRLMISVPRGKKGIITLEMLHIKLADPVDAVTLGELPVLRAAYDLKRGAYEADLPGATSQKSSWWLEVSDAPAKKVPLRNFIQIEYDATSTPGDGLVAEHSTYAMVWCQPSWFEPGSNVPEPTKIVHWEPGTKPRSARRGMKNGLPTLMVSTTYSPWSHWYGSYTAKGRRKSWTWARDLVQDSAGVWHLLEDNPKPWLVTMASFDLQELNAWVAEYKADPSARASCVVRSRAVKPGTKVFMPGVGDVTVPEGVKVIHECFLHRTKVQQTSFEAGLMAGIHERWEKKLNEAEKTWAVRVMSDGTVEHRIFNPVNDERDTYSETGIRAYESLRDFASKNPTIVLPKMHQGVDCAGDVGDPVFAICGGKLSHSGKETYNNPGVAAGRVATVTIWQASSGMRIAQTLHHRDLFGKTGDNVKAGDVIGTMGRTGNPEDASPTHAHFQCSSVKGGGISLEGCPVPGYEQILPHNDQPKLFPCGADYWNAPAETPASTAGTDANEDMKTSPKRCRGIPAYATNRENWIAGSCWAFAEDVCPHGMNAAKLRALRDADKMQDDEKRKADAAKKKAEADAKKSSAKP